MPKPPHGLSVTLSPFSKNGGLKSPLSPTLSQGKSKTATKPEEVGTLTEHHPGPAFEPTHGSFDNSLVSTQPSETMNPSARDLMPPPHSPSSATTAKSSQASGKSFFSSYNRTKTANRLHPQDATIRPVSRADTTQEVTTHQVQPIFRLQRASDSSPDVSSEQPQASDFGQTQSNALLVTARSYLSLTYHQIPTFKNHTPRYMTRSCQEADIKVSERPQALQRK